MSEALQMPEVVVVHRPNTSGADIIKAIQSTGIINAPFSLRTYVDKHPDHNEYNARLREAAFKATHLLLDDALYYVDAHDTNRAELSQGFSSAPHTSWLFEGDSVTSLIATAGCNRDQLIANSVLDIDRSGN